ncbi:hypothetical protein Bca4012_025343 [Brassica carinata]|uniref:D-fructose-1,6-bisphosphate 1-phosphohydrolase n=1 Tax=Brassica carinata TaxID=52824 RepID=A0A8X8ATA9_BRACI|nr:hypothetical protein Bca52824_022395 [Brassica carinata]
MWDESLRKYIDDLKDPGPSGKSYLASYIGSLVRDFHRTLLFGGYTGAAKSQNGMLRLLYQCAPKSFMLNKVEKRIIWSPESTRYPTDQSNSKHISCLVY